jgi:hypothetical protein
MSIGKSRQNRFPPTIDDLKLLSLEFFQVLLTSNGKYFSVTGHDGFSSRATGIQGNNVGIG